MRNLLLIVLGYTYAMPAFASGPYGYVTMLFGVVGMAGAALALTGTLLLKRSKPAHALHLARVFAFVAAGCFAVSLPDAYAVLREGHFVEVSVVFGLLSALSLMLAYANLRRPR
jgi:hypothetical protein